jgi:hypothetical protein
MTTLSRVLPALAGLLLSCLIVAPATAQSLGGHAITDLPEGLCPPEWESVFGAQAGVGNSGSDAFVFCSAVFDDGLGDGPVLYVGGDFTTAGGRLASNIARWDGSEWSEPPGGGVNQRIYGMAVHDDGTGPALYLGGQFTDAGGVPVGYLARWDGTSYTEVDGGVNAAVNRVRLIVDGTVEYLAIGGSFTLADGVTANRAALYIGASLVPFGDGFDGEVNDFAVYLGAIYAGGNFDASGATPLSNLARWTGSAWVDVDDGTSDRVLSLAAIDSGALQGLYVGGQFNEVGPAALATGSLARWQGGTWSMLGVTVGSRVEELLVWDDGGGQDLYAAGHISFLGGWVDDRNVVRWDGFNWSYLDIGTNQQAFSLTVHDDGSGESLWAGGEFTLAGVKGCNGIARYDGSAWWPVGGVGLNDAVRALCASDLIEGAPTLYVAGDFAVPGTTQDRGVAAWSDGAWEALGAIVNDYSDVHALAVFDDGSGPSLYAGGTFVTIGGVSVDRIARYFEGDWWPLGSGLDSWCYSLEVWDDGSGPALYVGGTFSTAGGVPAEGIARWNGTSFSALGDGLEPGFVNDMMAWDDGTGEALYATGSFDFSGSTPVNGIARWDGSAWSPLAGGLTTSSGSFPGEGHALEVFDDGSGPALYVGGSFTAADLVPDTVRLARWDGAAWSSVTSDDIEGVVRSLAVFDDTTGCSLYVGGLFTEIEDVPYAKIARWGSGGWSPVGLGVSVTASSISGSHGVFDMTIFDEGEGDGPRLMVGGEFSTVPDLLPQGASHLASWTGCWDDVNNWVDLGFATEGTFGFPLLTGSGSLSCGSVNEVNLTNAVPDELAGLFISVASTPTAFAGGTLIPVPWIEPILIIPSGISGAIPISFVMPPGVPSGSEIFVQWAIQDSFPTSGIALSNALRGDVP